MVPKEVAEVKVFGERLKELRINKNLSQDELGNIFNEHKAQSTIGTWERGTREPSMEDIIEIAKYFGVSIDFLFGLEEDKRSVTSYKEEKYKNPNNIIEFLENDNIEYNDLKLRKNEKDLIKRVLNAIFYEN